MSAVTIQQMADRVAGLMEERLGIRGADLAAKLKRGGHLLPRKVRVAAGRLAKAAEMAKTPRLMVQVDQGRVAADFDTCVRHLGAIDRRSRRIGAVLGVAASVALGILALAVAVIVVLKWRGYV
ncbi:MAG: hypothetical protein QM656_11595 [Paracoccaceae bacterium]